MLNFVVCAITNLFRVYLIRRFIKLFCPNAENAKFQEAIFYGFFFIVTTTLYWSFKTPWVNVMSNFLDLGWAAMPAGLKAMIFCKMMDRKKTRRA